MVEDVCETTGFLFWGPNETRKEVFPTKILFDFLFSSMLATYSAHLLLPLNNRWQRVELMKPSSSPLLLPPSYVLMSSALCSQAHHLGSALNVRITFYIHTKVIVGGKQQETKIICEINMVKRRNK
jgi:hypothetical protein